MWILISIMQKKEKYNTLLYLDDIVSNNGQSVTRSEERLSDDFANMYGLGASLAIALIKLGNPLHYDSAFKEKFNDIDRQAIAIFDSISELKLEHPSDCDRLLAMIEGLEYDYKNLKVDKKIKDQMKKDIDALKSLADEIKKCKGLIEDYDNKYMSKSASEAIKKGSTETKKERRYNDRKQVDKDWEKEKIII